MEGLRIFKAKGRPAAWQGLSAICIGLAAFIGVNAEEQQADFTLVDSFRPTQVYEAEGMSGEGWRFNDTYAGYSGFGYADFNGEGFIEWRVFVERDSSYKLSFGYSEGRIERFLAIEIDGEPYVPAFGFPPTGVFKGDWSVWATVTTDSTIQLAKGEHYIRASTTGRKGPNLDYLEMLDAVVPPIVNRVPGDTRGLGSGSSVKRLGDLNSDGKPELALGGYTTPPRGQVTIHSGHAGELVQTVKYSVRPYHLGWEIISLADVDGDQIGDFAAAGLDRIVIVYSGKTLTELYRFYAGGNVHIAAIGDLDGDQLTDIAVGSPHEGYGPTREGRVFLVSGATGRVLRTIDNPYPASEAAQFFGSPVLGAGDLTQDGVPDIVVGAWQQVVDGQAQGQFFAFSGATGSLIFDVANPGGDTAKWAEFGRRLAAVDDVDGDGVKDILAGAPWNAIGGLLEAGEAYIFSGANGDHLRTIESPSPTMGERFGLAPSAIPDIDGDGVRDYAVRTQGEGDYRYQATDVWYFFSTKANASVGSLESGLTISSMTEIGDWDGDGSPDIALSGDDDRSGRGVVLIYSVRTQALPIQVSIDIKPWSSRNLVDPDSTGLIPVAIHGGESFDALQCDLKSLRLSPGDAEARNYRVTDVNRDGFIDLLAYFRSRAIRVGCGTTEMDLAGHIHQGMEMHGSDTVTNMRCP